MENLSALRVLNFKKPTFLSQTSISLEWTTGCDNRLWQQVSICPGGRYPTNSTCRSFAANLRYCPKYSKHNKINRLDSLDRPSLTAKFGWTTLFVTKTRQISLTCWGFARLRDQSNCTWLSRIGSKRHGNIWKPLWKSHIDLYKSQPWACAPGLQNQWP